MLEMSGRGAAEADAAAEEGRGTSPPASASDGSDRVLTSRPWRSGSAGSGGAGFADYGDGSGPRRNGGDAGLGWCALTFIVLAALLTAGATLALGGSYSTGGARQDPPPNGGRQWATGRAGAVASTNYIATQAGLDVLKAGGNAVDAAAAVQFMLNVVQPQSNGIGGGCMLLYYEAKTGTVTAMDGREEAPAAFSEDAFCTDATCAAALPFFPERTTGGHPVGVPGTLAATERMLAEFGSGQFTLADVMAPAIKLAREGIPMSQHLYKRTTQNMARLKWFPASAKLFLNAAGTAPIAEPGQNWTNPDLAATFETIAKEGVGALYGGAIGQDIVDAVKAATNPTTGKAGLMTLDDIKGYRAVKRTPVVASIKGGEYTVYGHNNPGSGGATLALQLMLLDGLQLSSMAPLKPAALHRIIDAQNIAFSDRNAYLGDADFVDVPMAGLVNRSYTNMRRDALMRPDRAVPVPIPYGYPTGAPAGARRAEAVAVDTAGKHGTTHFSIADAAGNVVSWTTTIEENLGCGVVVPGRGFLLNNELTDFDALPKDADGRTRPNRPEGGKKARRTALGPDSSTLGGKRPRSSMTPTIIFKRRANGQSTPFLAIGSPGGSTIIGMVLNVILNHLEFGMSLVDATMAPRVVARNDQNVMIEAALDADTELKAQLSALGLNPSGDWGARPTGYVQSVELGDDGELLAVADTRIDTAGAAAF